MKLPLSYRHNVSWFIEISTSGGYFLASSVHAYLQGSGHLSGRGVEWWCFYSYICPSPFAGMPNFPLIWQGVQSSVPLSRGGTVQSLYTYMINIKICEKINYKTWWYMFMNVYRYTPFKAFSPKCDKSKYPRPFVCMDPPKFHSL